jgi:hypothetical protein
MDFKCYSVVDVGLGWEITSEIRKGLRIPSSSRSINTSRLLCVSLGDGEIVAVGFGLCRCVAVRVGASRFVSLLLIFGKDPRRILLISY